MDFESGKETDSAQDKLDVEYRQILRIIKPYIQTINNNIYLAQYRIWLEKLSETKDDEKFVRNQYLMELARQIQCKHLANPFTQTPPLGALPPLRGQPWTFEEPFENPYEDDSDPYLSKQRMCQQWAENNESSQPSARPQWPYHMPMPRPRRPSSNQQLLAAQRCVQRSATNVKKMNLLREIDEQCGDKYAEGSDSGATTPRSPPRQQRHAFAPIPPTPRPALASSPMPPPVPSNARLDFDPKKRPHQASLGVIHEDNADAREATSWDNLTDVSDASLAVLGCGDTENKREQKRVNARGDNFETKINTLMFEINGLKRKSEKVTERCENTIKKSSKEIVYITDEPPVRYSYRNFHSKISTLCGCFQDAADLKEATEPNGGGFIATDWKKIVESLQLRLSETQNQNRELNALTSTLHKKIKEMDATKEQVKQEIKKQILEQHKKEVESLKSEHLKNEQEMESSHQMKIKELEENCEKRVTEEKAKYENKMADSKERYEKELKDKDVEIRRLEDIIQRECMRLINEITVLRSQIEEASNTNTNNDERILFLQKCITKMDRLFQKSEREYCKKIEKLKQELDNRNKAIQFQIQLQTQKAEVITRCSAEKQSELDAIVRTLEDKYTTLLEMQQVQISRIRNEDEKIIGELRSILDQHNISYPY